MQSSYIEGIYGQIATNFNVIKLAESVCLQFFYTTEKKFCDKGKYDLT